MNSVLDRRYDEFKLPSKYDMIILAGLALYSLYFIQLHNDVPYLDNVSYDFPQEIRRASSTLERKRIFWHKKSKVMSLCDYLKIESCAVSSMVWCTARSSIG